MPVDYITLFKTLESNVIGLAKQSMSDYVNEAVADGNSIVASMKTDIEMWSLSLANGDIDADNFKSLVLGDMDLLKMDALTQAGLALIKVDEFKNAVCNLIVETVTTII